jgi:hypothetical protein
MKIKEFGGILFRLEKSVPLSILRVAPCLVALVCILPFIDILFRGLNFLVYLFGFISGQVAACF